MKYLPVKLPIYRGASEDNDPQGRRDGAFTSKGVTYFDRDSISTTQGLRGVASVTNARSLVNSGDSVLAVDSTGGITRVTNSGSSDTINSPFAFSLEQKGQYGVSEGVHSCQMADLGDVIALVVSEPKLQQTYSVTIRFVDPTTFQEVQDSITLSDNTIGGLISVAAVGTDLVVFFPDPVTLDLRMVKISQVGGVWSFISATAGGLGAPPFGLDVVATGADRISGVAVRTGGICYVFDLTVSTMTLSATDVSGSIPATDFPSGGAYAGWDGTNVWLAFCRNVATTGISFTSFIPGASALATFGTFSSSFYGAAPGGGIADVESTVGFVWDGTTMHAVTSGQWDSGTVQGTYGSSVFRGGTPSTLSLSTHAPSVWQIAKPFRRDSRLFFVGSSFSGWRFEEGAPLFGRGVRALDINTLVLEEPVYGNGVLVEFTADAQVAGMLGVDEVFPPTGTASSGSSVVLAQHIGSYLSDKEILAIPHKIRNEGSPSDQFKQGLGQVARLHKVSDINPSGVDTPSGTLVSMGIGTYLVTYPEVEDLMLGVPPMVYAYHPGTSSPADGTDPFRFCWAWVHASGAVFRSPPSDIIDCPRDNPVSAGGNRTFGITVQPPAPVSQFREGKLIFEAYMAVGGVYYKVHRQIVDSIAPVAFTFSAQDDQLGELLYTTGDRLASEAPQTTGNLLKAQNRFWAISNDRVFYSLPYEARTPIEFNSNLYVTIPDERVTGLASLDEQVVVFSEENVFIVRGSPGTRNGTGVSLNIVPIPTPSGCTNAEAVVPTPAGIFFLGERGVHLLQRNLSVVFVGHAVTDWFEGKTILNSFLDRDQKTVSFVAVEGSAEFHIESGLWSIHEAPTYTDGVYSLALGRVALVGDEVRTRTAAVEAVSGDSFDSADSPTFVYSTPWITTRDVPGGMQRVRAFTIEGRAILRSSLTAEVFDSQGTSIADEVFNAQDPRTFITVRVYRNNSAVADTEQIYDLRDFELDPLNIKLDNSFRKCRTFRLEVEVPAFTGELMISGVTAYIQPTQNNDKGLKNSKGH